MLKRGVGGLRTTCCVFVSCSLRRWGGERLEELRARQHLKQWVGIQGWRENDERDAVDEMI